MDDPVTWLRAQLDQQEAALIAYRDHRAGLTPCDNLDDYDSCSEHIRTAEATEYRNVAYGLAEVDAKRRILDEIVDDANGLDMSVDLDRRVGTRDMAAEPYLGDQLVRLLAPPYAERDGYREERRP